MNKSLSKALDINLFKFQNIDIINNIEAIKFLIFKVKIIFS